MAMAALSAHLRFSLPKCCAMHEWPLWRAAPQHLKVVVNGRFGPFVTFDTKGGELSLAAAASPL